MTALLEASFNQRHLWLMDRLAGGSGLMTVPLVYRMHGELDRDALRGSLGDLLARHEVLRSEFRRGRSLGYAIRNAGACAVPVREIDLTAEPDPAQAAAQSVPELLRSGPGTDIVPLSAFVLALGPADHLLVVDVHHLVTDGWSNMLISRDLAAFYSARRMGRPVALPPVDWQHSQFAQWQRGRLAGPALGFHREFWARELSGGSAVSLAGGAAGADSGPEANARHRPPNRVESFELDTDLTRHIEASARRLRVTPFVLLLTAFFHALRTLTGEDDLTIASVFANRPSPQVQETVGPLANMVPLRARLGDGGDGPVKALAAVRRAVLACLAHQELPYALVPLDTLQDHSPGTPASVVFQMLAVPPSAVSRAQFAGLTVAPQPIPAGIGARFDVEMLIAPESSGAGLAGFLRYNPARIAADLPLRLCELYRMAVSQLLDA
jgi:hypothetical protein